MATKAERRQAATNRRTAMVHPLRAEILRVLSERTASPAELARRFGAPLESVSYHTKRLVKLECAELVSTRPVRGAIEHFYRATERHLVDTAEWQDLPSEAAAELVRDFMQVIVDDFTDSASADMVGSDENFHLTRTRLILDREGLRKALAIHERARLEIQEVHAESVARALKSGEETIHVSTFQGCFQAPAA